METVKENPRPFVDFHKPNNKLQIGEKNKTSTTTCQKFQASFNCHVPCGPDHATRKVLVRLRNWTLECFLCHLNFSKNMENIFCKRDNKWETQNEVPKRDTTCLPVSSVKSKSHSSKRWLGEWYQLKTMQEWREVMGARYEVWGIM